jgi:hypothetical protein
MDLSAELRYYEIRFTKLINQFFRVYKLDKLLTFIEMLTFISGAELMHVKTAMQRVITNDTKIRVGREEYIICLKLFSGLNNTQIRQVARCSPNTIINAMETYNTKQIFIQPKFELTQSDEIRKVMKSLIEISNIY